MSAEGSQHDRAQTPVTWVGCFLLDALSDASHRAIYPLVRILKWRDVPRRPRIAEHFAMLKDWEELYEGLDKLGEALSGEFEGRRIRNMLRDFHMRRDVQLGRFSGKCYPDALRVAVQTILETFQRRANPIAWQQGKAWAWPTIERLEIVTNDWKGLRAELREKFAGFPPRDKLQDLVDQAMGCRYQHCPLEVCQDGCLKWQQQWESVGLQRNIAAADLGAVSDALENEQGVKSPPTGMADDSLGGAIKDSESPHRFSHVDRAILKSLGTATQGLTADELITAIGGGSRPHLITRCGKLMKDGLVANPHKGYRLTPRGLQVSRALSAQP